jgi:hypothetical protein
MDRDGVKPDPSKVATVTAWPVPKEVPALRGFLGLCNYYFRTFIHGYTSLAAPLTALTSAKATWDWSSPHQYAFEALKAALSSAPVLALPDFTLPFQVIADASLMGTGVVLVQNGRPVAFYSHKFAVAEKNYTTGDQELLAVVLALESGTVIWRELLRWSWSLTTNH